MTSLLGLAVRLLLFQPALSFWASQVKQNCKNGSYEISVLMMGNSAYKEPMQNLKEAVEEGLDIVRKRLREAGKTMVKNSFFLWTPFCFKATSQTLPITQTPLSSSQNSILFPSWGEGLE